MGKTNVAKDKTLPTRPVVGDRIRLNEEHMTEVMKAAKLAGYDFDEYAVRVVVRIDQWAPGGGSRLFVDGPPHCFYPRQVKLAWNTELERREALVKRGWKPS